MPTYNFVLISGGPGIYDPKDTQAHDRSWANYVTPPLMLASNGGFVKTDEKVVWYVYKPAYDERWNADVENEHRKDFIQKAVADVKAKGFTSYVDMIDSQVKKKGWSLDWLDDSSSLWSKMKNLSYPIVRVWYWGMPQTICGSR